MIRELVVMLLLMSFVMMMLLLLFNIILVWVFLSPHFPNDAGKTCERQCYENIEVTFTVFCSPSETPSSGLC